MYTDSNGVIDYEYMPWMPSIKSIESDFSQDLDGDGVTGIDINDATQFDTISTDTDGDQLKKDSTGALYIIDDNDTTDDVSDDTTITIKDSYGGVPYFDYSYSGVVEIMPIVIPHQLMLSNLMMIVVPKNIY